MTSALSACCSMAARLLVRQTSVVCSSTPMPMPVRSLMWDARVYTPPVKDPSLLDALPDDHPARIKLVQAAKPAEVISSLRHPVIDKFVQQLMRRGERQVAERVVMNTLEVIKRIQYKRWTRETDATRRAAIERDPRKIMVQALLNCKPLIRLTTVKRGGIAYQVPAPVNDQTAMFLALRAMRNVVRDTKPRAARMWDELAKELLLAYDNEGKVVKKKEELHRQAEANRAYAHYRFIKSK